MPCLLVKGIFYQTILEVVKKGKSTGLTKAEILNACHGKVDGFYEPDKYEHQYKVVVQNPETAGKTSSKQDEPLMDLRLTKSQSLTLIKEREIPPLSPLRKGGKGDGKSIYW